MRPRRCASSLCSAWGLVVLAVLEVLGVLCGAGCADIWGGGEGEGGGGKGGGSRGSPAAPVSPIDAFTLPPPRVRPTLLSPQGDPERGLWYVVTSPEKSTLLRRTDRVFLLAVQVPYACFRRFTSRQRAPNADKSKPVAMAPAAKARRTCVAPLQHPLFAAVCLLQACCGVALRVTAPRWSVTCRSGCAL
jgi:hypothetical protein